MISLSATVDFANNHLGENGRLILSTGHLIPEEFLATYRRTLKVQNRVPAKSNRLRRSVRYQLLGNQAIVQWLAPYAAAQEAGMSNGRVYKNYTKAGTGRGFGQQALNETRASFIAAFQARHPEIGLK